MQHFLKAMQKNAPAKKTPKNNTQTHTHTQKQHKKDHARYVGTRVGRCARTGVVWATRVPPSSFRCVFHACAQPEDPNFMALGFGSAWPGEQTKFIGGPISTASV